VVGITPEDYPGTRSPASRCSATGKRARSSSAAATTKRPASWSAISSRAARRPRSARAAVVQARRAPGRSRTLAAGLRDRAIREALPAFDKQIKGFAMHDAVLTGVETRTSSPLRITRDDYQSLNTRGLYPAGEGAGYAGGILSAGVDGRLIVGDAEFPEEGFASGPIYLGSPQISADIPTWRVERDLTDVSRLFQRTHPIFITAYFDNPNQVDDEVLQITGRVGRLVFYPPTASTPAQRRADAVFGLGSESQDNNGSASLTRVFPRNIQQAHLDVLARVLGASSGIERSWWACVPDSAIAAHPYLRNGFAIGNARANEVAPLQGCGGGSFRELEVLIDGQLAGLAPVFPWLTSNISTLVRNTVDLPAPSVQALNLAPVRVDLTPFAGLLNNGVAHEITVRLVNGSGYVSGTLLLDLDEGRAVVPGAVTRNTLASQVAAPVETVALNEQSVIVGELDARHLTGTVTTRSNREYRIEGYVDTSRGRVQSFVYSNNRFLDTVTFDVTSSPQTPLFDFYFADYGQKVRLSSTVDRVSREPWAARCSARTSCIRPIRWCSITATPATSWAVGRRRSCSTSSCTRRAGSAPTSTAAAPRVT
jgi:hypothetical protein